MPMFRRALFMMVLAAALGLSYFYFIFKPISDQKRLEGQNGRLLPVSSYQEVQSIQIMPADQPVICLERQGAGWQITHPHRSEANFILASGVAMALSKARKFDSFDTRLADYEAYGFKEPRLKLRVEVAGRAKTNYELWIGQKHPIQDAYYARWTHEPDETFLLQENLVNALRKTEYALREKQVFAFENANVNRITIELFGGFVQLYRGIDGRWHLRDWPQSQVDEDRIFYFLDALRNIYVKEFLDELAEKDASSGLESSPNRVTILFDDGSYDILVVGNSVDQKNAYYAQKNPGHFPIVLLAKPNVHALARQPKDFMDRRIVRLKTEEIERMELARGSRQDIFEKTKAGIWKQVNAGKESVLTQETISDIISEIRYLNFDRLAQPVEGDSVNESGESLAALRFLNEKQRLLSEIHFLRVGQKWYASNLTDKKVYELSESDLQVLGSLIDSVQPVS